MNIKKKSSKSLRKFVSDDAHMLKKKDTLKTSNIKHNKKKHS